MRNHTYMGSFSFLRFCSSPIKSIQNILSKWRKQTISHLNKKNFLLPYSNNILYNTWLCQRDTPQTKKLFTYLWVFTSFTHQSSWSCSYMGLFVYTATHLSQIYLPNSIHDMKSCGIILDASLEDIQVQFRLCPL